VAAKRAQIHAGHVPPVTVNGVRGGSMGMDPRGYPTHTAAESPAVYPTNQASTSSWVVPVFPATGRPIQAWIPVPRRTTSSSARVTSSATARLTASVTTGISS
jgi:hypothetical protein